jgi:predicted nucleic acid-binding protein
VPRTRTTSATSAAESAPSAWLHDGSVLAALSLAGHVHHARALHWFDAHDAPFATCAATQGTLLRLHLQLSPHPSSAAAWAALREAAEHPAQVYWDDGLSYLEIDPSAVLGNRQVTDAWLAELARRHRGRVATFDAAFASAHADVVDLLPEVHQSVR